MTVSSNPSDENIIKNHEARQMYEAVCDMCHTDISIPFEPIVGRTVLCKSCLRKNREKKQHTNYPNKNYHNNNKKTNRTNNNKSYEIICSHCGKKDVIPFEPFEGSTVLCSECMNNPNISRLGSRIMHTIICSVCGKQSRVPFNPDAGSRVLCKECHLAERAQKIETKENFAKTHPSVVHGTKVRVDIRCERCGSEDNLPFIPKTDGPILCKQCAEDVFGENWADRHSIQTQEFSFYCSKCGKQDFVPFRLKHDKQLLCKHCLNDQAILRDNNGTPKQRIDPYLCIRHKNNNN